jgi:hypothetical protein
VEFEDFSLRWRSVAFRSYRFIRSLADSKGLSDVIDSDAVAGVVRADEGIAGDVTRR